MKQLNCCARSSWKLLLKYDSVERIHSFGTQGRFVVVRQKCTSRKQNLSNAGNIVFEHKKTYLFKTYLTWMTHFSSMGKKRINRPGTKGPSWV